MFQPASASILVKSATLSFLLTFANAIAQQPGSAPAATTPPPPPDAATLHAQHVRQMTEDFPWLGRYRDADASLPPPAPGENRVVFMGDSITEFWRLDSPWGFPGKPYIDRGIAGQTTPQMLLRFQQDVVSLKPRVVVILAGTNDIAGATGPETPEQIEHNLASMAGIAAANHIRVVFCSLLPAYSYPWNPTAAPAAKIVALNQWISQYAAANHHIFVDVHTPLKDERGGLPAQFSGDGVHPNRTAYAIMAPLIEAGIEKALAN